MSTDFRFHIASLAAVFLALGIGVLIGTAFVGAPVVERQTRLIQNVVERQNRVIRDSDATAVELRREAQTGEAAWRALQTRLMRGTLAGRHVLVVQTGNYADAERQTVEALRLAGAQAVRVTLPPEAWRRHAQAGSEENKPGARTAAGAFRLAPHLIGGQNAALLDFRQAGLVTGDVLDRPLQLVVLVGGAEGVSQPDGTVSADEALALVRELDATLIQAWQALGVVVVGVEPALARASFMRAYQALGIATIDNIDRALGQIALPFALSGDKAAYGTKPTADRGWPRSLEQPEARPAVNP